MDELEVNQRMSRVLLLDEGIGESTLCMMGCNTGKVIAMLEPLFSQFLQHRPDLQRPSSTEVVDYVASVQRRAAVAMLAMLSMDLKSHSPSSSLPILPEGLTELSLKASCHLLYCPPFSKESTEDIVWTKWKCPVVSYLCCDDSFIPLVLEFLVSQLDPDHCNTKSATLVSLMLEIVTEPLLQDPVHRSLQELTIIVRNVHARFGKGAVEEPSGRLVAHLEAIAQTKGKTSQKTIIKNQNVPLSSLVHGD